MHSKLVSFALLATLSACAHTGVPVDRTKPIEFSGSWLSREALQGGQRLNPKSLQDALLLDPASAPSVRSARGWGMVAGALGAAGGAVLGFSVGSGNADAGALAAGAGLIAIALPMAYLSDRKMAEAVDGWNASRGPSGPSACVVRDATGAAVAVGGYWLTF